MTVGGEPEPQVRVEGAFDDLRLRGVRFLEEAARHGPVHVRLLTDEATEWATGHRPRFGEEERRYLVESIRWVSAVSLVERSQLSASATLPIAEEGSVWVIPEGAKAAAHFARAQIPFHSVAEAELAKVPDIVPELPGSPPRKRPLVLVTGCYDWLHSGHVRFFEEASAFGDLVVTVGSDDSLRAHKGPRHPLQTASERRYMVSAIRHVSSGLVASGSGWLDAAPELGRLRPDFLVVNEDGDRTEKRALCERLGVGYLVLSRAPKKGLPRRSSTDLRGY